MMTSPLPLLRCGCPLLALALLAVGACLLLSRPSAADAPPPTIKNVIIFIGDGMGFNQVLAADYYQYGAADTQVYEHFPVRLACSTYAGEGRAAYDPQAVQADFHWVKSGPTDSAAAATALACGVKTYNAAIGMRGTKPADAARAENILEVAERGGKSSGVVTSVEFSHATPAGFVAHNAKRDAYQAIAEEMVNASAADVIMGCGHPLFDNSGKKVEKPHYTFIGEVTWKQITDGTAGAAVDADQNGKRDDAWTVLQDRAAFQELATAANPPKRVLGIPPVLTTLQQARGGAKKDDLPYAVPRTASVPTLAEMTAGALNVLGRNPRGFVVMIEGGAIDWACHASHSSRVIEEVVDFNRAVETAVNWVTEHSSWRDTLLIVTADHETGYLTGPRADPAKPVWSMVTNAGQGKLPGMDWHGGGHTNSLVPFFAMGQGSAMLRARAARFDPRHGPFLDNTDLFHVLHPILR